MARVDHAVSIKAPLDEVFAVVGDPVRWPEFQSSLRGGERVDEATYRLHGGSTKGPFFYEIVVTEHRPPERIAWHYGGAVKGAGAYTLSAGPDGTRLHLEERLRLALLPPFRWIADRFFFNRSFNADARHSLERLRRILERTPDAGD